MEKRIIQFRMMVKVVMIGLLLWVVGMTKGYAWDHSDVIVDDLRYNLNDNSLTAYVIGHIQATSATGDLIIPSSVTYTDDENVTRTYSVTIIGTCAFFNCYGFTSLSIPNSVKWIFDSAFSGCSGFTGSLSIPNSVYQIGEEAFSNCSGFDGTLTIGSSVSSIGYHAFVDCRNFSSMICFANTPPTIEWNAFYRFPNNIPVYIPYGTLDAYMSALGWSGFTNYQEMPSLNTTQTIELSAGWNWLSTNVEITLDDLKTALMSAVPNTSVAIKSRMQNTAYNPSTNQWRGTLDSLDVAQMYMISVGTDCEITLTGMSINPTEHPITIQDGVNWIAFPFNESMSVGDAFGEFVMDGDIIKSRMNNASYNNGQWRGSLNTLVPGQGYMYLSNATESRIFAYPSAK